MAHYLIRAKIVKDLKPELKEKLNDDKIKVMEPFGNALHFSLTNARITDDDHIIWEEEDYCTPPLAMEREAVLDKYFRDLEIVRVEKGEGWSEIEDRPFLWGSEKGEEID